MKKILFLGIVFLFVFIIYLANMDKEVYYLALGDSFDSSDNYSFYVKDYLKEKNVLEKGVFNYCDKNDMIIDIYNRIINNQRSKSGTLKNSLVKADLVTLKINMEDIIDRFNDSSITNVYNYIDDLTNDFDSLLNLIRKYCKEDIIFIGYYSFNNDYTDYLNKKYKKVCRKYNVRFVNNCNCNAKELGYKVIDVASKYLFEG